MSVSFTTITFHNTAGVDVTLTIEAPPGTVVVGPTTVGSMSSGTFDPEVNDCAAVLLQVVSDADPGDESQTFAVQAPLYLKTLEVSYFIGSFDGSVTAVTEGFGGAKAPDKRKPD